MSSRVELSRTPAGILGLALPCAALALMGIVAFTQRSDAAIQTADISNSDSIARAAAARMVENNPIVGAPSLAVLRDPRAAVPKDTLREYKLAHALTIVNDLENQAARTPDGMTPISQGELRLLQRALAEANAVR